MGRIELPDKYRDEDYSDEGYAPRPATRVGRTVMFEGGRTVRLSLAGWALFALGVRTHLSTRTKRKES